MSDTSLRTYLRQETAERHAELDALVGEWQDLAGYAQYLQGLYGFRAALEPALAGALADWQIPIIADYLKQDLADLNLSASAITVPDLAWNRSSALGASYVLEGSGVGARLLRRRAEALGLSENHGARHLAAQTADKSRWPQFIELMQSAPQIDAEQAAKGAELAFALALASFRNEHHVLS